MLSHHRHTPTHTHTHTHEQLSTNCLSPGEAAPGYGTLVDPFVNAQFHQVGTRRPS
jgi:hypothetical protein